MDYMCIYFIHLPGSTPFSTFHLKPPAVCTDWSEEKRFFLPVDTTFFGYCSGFRQCAATPEMWWKNWWLLSLGITRERQIWRISWLKLANHGRRLFLRGCSSHHQRGGDKKRDHLSGAKSAISLWLSQHLSFPPPPLFGSHPPRCAATWWSSSGGKQAWAAVNTPSICRFIDSWHANVVCIMSILPICWHETSVLLKQKHNKRIELLADTARNISLYFPTALPDGHSWLFYPLMSLNSSSGRIAALTRAICFFSRLCV